MAVVRKALGSRSVVLAVGLVLGLGTTWAWAAIPNSASGRIVGCYPKTGAKVLRVIDFQAGQRCTASEVQVTWQADGLRFRGGWTATAAYFKGDVVTKSGTAYVARAASTNRTPPNVAFWSILAAQGPIGATGPAGAAGAVGATGAVGPNGSAGPAGATGPAGAAGLDGATGATGPAGTNGTDGATGPAGPPGGRTLSDIAQLKWYPGKVATVGVGAKPTSVAFDGRYIWAVMEGNGIEPQLSNRVYKIDPATNSFVDVIPVGDTPRAIVFDGTHMWVANNTDGTVSRIDVATDTVVQTLSVGTAPTGLAFDGSRIFVANSGSASISRLDAATGLALSNISVVGTVPVGLAYDGSSLWVTDLAGDSVLKVNPDTGATLSTIAVGDGPWSVITDGFNLWVANRNSGTISRVSQLTGAVVATVPVGVGDNPSGLAFDGTYVWVALPATGAENGKICAISRTTNTCAGFVTVSLQPMGMAFDGTNLWVTNAGSFTVDRIRP